MFFSILAGDFIKGGTQGGLVRGVAAHGFVANGQAVGGDDEGYDDLQTVGAFVPTVSKGFEIAGFGSGAVGIDFEVGTSQVVQEDVVGGLKEVGPAIFEMSEEGIFVLQEKVVTAVEGVFGGEAEIVFKEVGDGTVVEPAAVKFPFAAGVEKAVDDEGFEDFEPRGAFARGTEQGGPEVVELEAIPEFKGKPAAAPLTGTGEFKAAEVKLNGGVSEVGSGSAILGKEVDLMGLFVLVECFDGPGPTGAFGVVDFAEIKNGLLDGAFGGESSVFNNTPVAVLFAVLDPFCFAQKHESARRIAPNS